jgi:molecular chaperone GrpE
MMLDENQKKEQKDLSQSPGDEDGLISESSLEENEEDVENDQISDLKKEIESLKDKWLRTAAELENVRKQSIKKEELERRYAITKFAKDLLPGLDSLEQALKQCQDQSQKELFTVYVEGLLMIQKIFVGVLRESGVERILTLGEVFDPKLHQAVAQEEDASEDRTIVVEEYLPGYRIHDRVLRTAMVKVKVPKSN